MVQFNLLPDVKLEYVKTQRTKRMLTLVSAVVSIISIVVLLLGFVAVDVVQKKSLDDLNSDIATYSSKVKGVKNLDKILTVQNQLSTLTGLHDSEPVASRLFSYLSQITPDQASLNQLSVDFTANTITLSGSAPNLDVVSAYTDTLKATTYTTDTDKTATKVFSKVVLGSFGLGGTTSATFSISADFDPIIFKSGNTIKLTVPATAQADQSNVFATGN